MTVFSTTPTLSPIGLAPIDHGGYHIRVNGSLPTGAKIYLSVGDSANRFEMTTGYNRTLMPALLKCIGTARSWGTMVKCFATIETPGASGIRTPAVDLSCPVQPFTGELTLAGIGNAKPALTYPGNGHGRTLTERIDGAYYFRHGHTLETQSPNRGFDCTTFPMAVFQCSVNMAGKYGTSLADALGATACGMEQQKEPAIKAFFADRSRGGLGTYFMWSAGHVVLAKDGTLHQFTHGGYRRDLAGHWQGYRYAPQGLWWIRKLPASLRA
jgi:hypothetical protein